MSSSLALLSGCDYYDSRLKVVNSTTSPICIETFKDTLPKKVLNQPEYYLSHIILPGDTAIQTIPGKNAWLYEVETSVNKQLNLFVYSPDSVRIYHDMDSLNSKKVFKRISLSLEELESRNWNVAVE
jgi:hypothetical protein